LVAYCEEKRILKKQAPYCLRFLLLIRKTHPHFARYMIMAKVFLNPFGKFNRVKANETNTLVTGGVTTVLGAPGIEVIGSGAQVFDGACSQDRVLVAATGAFNNAAPALTVAAGTEFIQIVSDGPVLVWSGLASVTSAVKQARAFAAAAGTYSLEVAAGDQVFVWTAP
jgi:hypothetical protein